MTLSVCLIVKDEEEVIGRCLDCVKEFADEIIVVDTGSTDGTVNEVKRFTDKVYFFKWRDDFSAARNFAFEKATCDFVMWLDADDLITAENIKKIIQLKDIVSEYDMVMMNYAASFDGDKPTFVYRRERIFRRDKNYKFSGAVHEAVTPNGRIYHSDAAIYHKKIKRGEPLRNLKIYQKQISSGEMLDGRQKFYYGRELLFNRMYREAIAVLEDFLNGEGWVVNKCEACLNLHRAYLEIGDETRAMSSLLRSLTFASPNAETCCILGDYFFGKNEYKSAAYWYENALKCTDSVDTGGFVNLDFCGFIPYIQLCVIYFRLGEREKAFAYNEAAGRIKPENENYLYNKNFFENIGIRGIIND